MNSMIFINEFVLMAHIHLSQALGKGFGSLFFFDHEPLARRSQ